MLTGIIFVTSLARGAESVLKLVPESAYGFAVLNKPAEVDKKLVDLGRLMSLPIPNLLPLFKERSGAREAWDERQAVVFVVLPPAAPGGRPAPVLLLPVTDFNKFVQQLNPEPDAGELKQVKFFGEKTWVRNIGGRAALTGEPWRSALEKGWEPSAEVPASLAALEDWVAQNDVTAIIQSPGVKFIAAQVRQGIKQLQATLSKAGPEGQSAAAVFDIYGKLFQAAEKEVAVFGIGLHLSEQKVLRVTTCTEAVPGGEWARLLAQAKPARENLLAGLPAGAFVAAGGGCMSETMWDVLMQLSIDVITAMPRIYGIGEEQAKKLPAATFPAMKQIRSVSTVLGVVESGEPIFARMVSVMRVEDSRKYLVAYAESLRQYAALMKDSASPLMPAPEVEETKLGDLPALQLTMKMPQMPADRPIPNFDQMMEVMFGKGGRVTGWVAVADARTVVIGYNDKQQLLDTIQAIQQGRAGLGEDAGVAQTAALLPKGAMAVAYWSPQGTLDFVGRVLTAVVPPNARANLKLPQIEATPPVGFAVLTRSGELRTDLVVPAEVLKAVGRTVADLLRGRSP
jgi:hypothetical protein